VDYKMGTFYIVSTGKRPCENAVLLLDTKVDGALEKWSNNMDEDTGRRPPTTSGPHERSSR